MNKEDCYTIHVCNIMSYLRPEYDINSSRVFCLFYLTQQNGNMYLQNVLIRRLTFIVLQISNSYYIKTPPIVEVIHGIEKKTPNELFSINLHTYTPCCNYIPFCIFICTFENTMHSSLA